MRILSISLDQSIGIPKSRAARQAGWFSDAVEHMTIIVPGKKDQEVVLAENIIVKCVSGNNKVTQFLRLFETAVRCIKKERIDIITTQDPYFLGFIAARLSEKYHIGLHVQIHGWEKKTWLRQCVAQYVLKHADSVRVVSARLAQYVKEFFAIPSEIITVIPIFSDTRELLALPRSYGHNSSVHFLTVGRLVPVKQILLQIQAIEQLLSKYPNIELSIVGNGTERHLLETYVIEHGLDQSIHFCGEVSSDELQMYYQNADVFLLTSSEEGWGMVIVEAAAAGLPIIMTDVGCAGEFIRNKENGYVIPVGDMVSLCGTMEQYITHHEERKKMGESARYQAQTLPTDQVTKQLYLHSWSLATGKKHVYGK